MMQMSTFYICVDVDNDTERAALILLPHLSHDMHKEEKKERAMQNVVGIDEDAKQH